MEFILKAIVFIHILAGSITLLSGPFAIFYNFKNIRNHRIAGKIFFFAMLVVCVSAVISFIKQPNVIFYQFLLGIALLVLAGVARGVRAVVVMKGGQVQRFDMVYTIGLGILGLSMLARAAWLSQTDVTIAFPILFGVFGFNALRDAVKNIKIFFNPSVLSKKDWMQLHLQSMLGAFIASSTAFTVNAAHFLPWYLQWFGPTLLLMPVVFYFERKVRGI